VNFVIDAQLPPALARWIAAQGIRQGTSLITEGLILRFVNS